VEASNCQPDPIITGGIRTEVTSHYLPNIADCIAGEEDKHPESTKKSGVAVQVTGKQLVCRGRGHTETGKEDIYKRHLGRAGVGAASGDGVHCVYDKQK
jgi:hypothetical protein